MQSPSVASALVKKSNVKRSNQCDRNSNITMIEEYKNYESRVLDPRGG